MDINQTIRVSKLTKKFNQKTVLKELDFSMRRGEITSLIGPNGAGKTTLVKCIAGLCSYEEGEIQINTSSSSKRSIGFIPQEIALYQELTVYQNLKFWASLYNIRGNNANKIINAYLEFVDLIDRANDKVSELSGGMKRKVHIAAGILHDPDVILMDEPTVGIDPSSRQDIYSIINQLRAKGKSVLYTSHYMHEVEDLSDYIYIIKYGSIISKGRKEEILSNETKGDLLRITFKSPIDSKLLSNWKQDHQIISENEISLQIKEGQSINDTLLDISKDLPEIQSIKSIEENLESIFLDLTQDKQQ